MDMECVLPGTAQQSKIIRKSRHVHEIPWWYYTTLLKNRHFWDWPRCGTATDAWTTCQKDMVPDNTILNPITFASKSLTGTEQRYSNIEREALGILHGLKKFHHYCFTREVFITPDHKPLVAIFKKDMATLLQCIQCILLKIHQYRVQILYKPGLSVFIADWVLQHNHKEGKDKPIRDIRIDYIQCTPDILECISISQIQHTTAQDEHL